MVIIITNSVRHSGNDRTIGSGQYKVSQCIVLIVLYCIDAYIDHWYWYWNISLVRTGLVSQRDVCENISRFYSVIKLLHSHCNIKNRRTRVFTCVYVCFTCVYVDLRGYMHQKCNYGARQWTNSYFIKPEVRYAWRNSEMCVRPGLKLPDNHKTTFSE